MRLVPDEVAADRPSKLETVTRAKLVGEVGRHFAVVEPFDEECHVVVVGRRRDRVAALSLVAVFSSQADVDVLAGAMS